jgi:hypothetical protein
MSKRRQIRVLTAVAKIDEGGFATPVEAKWLKVEEERS